MGVPNGVLTQPWVLIAGGFHRNGGMDRLNWALADYLAERGNPVHLVCHNVESSLASKAATVTIVRRPAGSFMLGGLNLASMGRRIADRISHQHSATRVVVNGGNCNWPDINWVHCVHHAWRRRDASSPAWFRVKSRYAHRQACRQERAALGAAQVLIANSEHTRRDLIDHLRIDPERIHVVYPGADPDFMPPVRARRAAARAWLGKSEARPLIAFVGALGHDSNKGFDVLFSAWSRLCARPDWDVDLIVAGAGRALDLWKRRIAEAGLAGRISMLGFTDRVADVLAAADLLVSPVRYESYGLNVQEAICCGVPAMVTRTAGVAERYPADLWELLIDNPEDAGALAHKILQWRSATPYWKQRVMPLSQTLRAHTLEDMAREVVEVALSN